MSAFDEKTVLWILNTYHRNEMLDVERRNIKLKITQQTGASGFYYDMFDNDRINIELNLGYNFMTTELVIALFLHEYCHSLQFPTLMEMRQKCTKSRLFQIEKSCNQMAVKLARPQFKKRICEYLNIFLLSYVVHCRTPENIAKGLRLSSERIMNKNELREHYLSQIVSL